MKGEGRGSAGPPGLPAEPGSTQSQPPWGLWEGMGSGPQQSCCGLSLLISAGPCASRSHCLLPPLFSSSILKRMSVDSQDLFPRHSSLALYGTLLHASSSRWPGGSSLSPSWGFLVVQSIQPAPGCRFRADQTPSSFLPLSRLPPEYPYSPSRSLL